LLNMKAFYGEKKLEHTGLDAMEEHRDTHRPTQRGPKSPSTAAIWNKTRCFEGNFKTYKRVTL
jgi:hypothetical protein